MNDQLLGELLARGAEEWESLRQSAPIQWARDRRRCLFDTPDVTDAPDALAAERADPRAETMRLDTIEAHRAYRSQAKLWGRDHRQTDESFARYDTLLGRFLGLAGPSRVPKLPATETVAA